MVDIYRGPQPLKRPLTRGEIEESAARSPDRRFSAVVRLSFDKAVTSGYNKSMDGLIILVEGLVLGDTRADAVDVDLRVVGSSPPSVNEPTGSLFVCYEATLVSFGVVEEALDSVLLAVESSYSPPADVGGFGPEVLGAFRLAVQAKLEMWDRLRPVEIALGADPDKLEELADTFALTLDPLDRDGPSDEYIANGLRSVMLDEDEDEDEDDDGDDYDDYDDHDDLDEEDEEEDEEEDLDFDLDDLAQQKVYRLAVFFGDKVVPSAEALLKWGPRYDQVVCGADEHGNGSLVGWRDGAAVEVIAAYLIDGTWDPRVGDRSYPVWWTEPVLVEK